MKLTYTILILIVTTMLSNAQDNYSTDWTLVKKFENEGLTKSALQTVTTIYKKAKAENNNQQSIKALLYKSKYVQTVEENAQLKIIQSFKTEIEATNLKSPSYYVLHNMLATIYWHYFKQNRYKFYNRTQTTAENTADFRLWDLQTLFNTIHKHYQLSLQNSALLNGFPIEKFETLISIPEHTTAFTPTVFDVLAHNALNFYKTPENSITKPAETFQLNTKDYLANTAKFNNLNLKTPDSVSLRYNALKIYQHLSTIHKKNTVAYAYNTIERLKFVQQNTNLTNSIALILNTYKSEEKAAPSKKIGTLYNYEIATLLKLQGDSYNAKDKNTTQHQWKLKEALNICNTILKQDTFKSIKNNTEVLKASILSKSLKLKAYKHIPNNTFSKVLVSYKNLNSITFNIIKVNASELETFNHFYKAEHKLSFLKKRQPEIRFTKPLKTENDYQNHSTEVVLPKLNNGLYIIYSTTSNDDNIFATATLQATNIAVIYNEDNINITYQVIDRNNGKPLQNTTITVDYKNNKNETFTTNALGEFTISKSDSYYRDVNIRVQYNKDTAIFGDYYFNRKVKTQTPPQYTYRHYVFTDRSIYRPSQSVYFKGIFTQTEFNKTTTVVENQSVTATLFNANNQKISDLTLKTNAFGSYNGVFNLPDGGLTGNYRIQVEAENGNKQITYIKVEAYKRPKFNTEFKPVTQSYKLNESITINGVAKAYTGSNISNAKVSYIVTRKVQYPNWEYWRVPIHTGKAQQISFGTTTTNAKGEFEISFTALPDESTNKNSQPVFTFEVTANVTDINGETQSNTTLVNVGYHSMVLNIDVPQQINTLNKKALISINPKNLNNQNTTAKGTLRVFKLKVPQQVVIPSPWELPDYQQISETEHLAKFPHLPYKSTNRFQNPEKGELVFTTTFNTENSAEVELKPIKKWDSGLYIIEVEAKDAFNQSVTNTGFTKLYNPKDTTVADNSLFTYQLDKATYQPGDTDTAILTIGSAAKSMYVTLSIEKNNTIVSTEIIELNNSIKTLKIPINKTDVGGFTVRLSYAAFNYYVYEIVQINVPYPNTDLQVETATFRDVLQPGKPETWTFTVKGAKGDKVAAEILASMYDASLDAFQPHQWQFTPLAKPNYYSNRYTNSRRSFNIGDFNVFNKNSTTTKRFITPQYSQLHWFGFYFGHNQNIRIRGYNSLTGSPGSSDTVMASPMMEKSNLEEVVTTGNRDKLGGKAAGINIIDANVNNSDEKKPTPKANPIRNNLNETAFFYPNLQTDSKGNVSFSFTSPEALTTWKLQLLAHTKTLNSKVIQLKTVTQKELMVLPNTPRFLRETDTITISTKIANLSPKTLTGEAYISLINTTTGEDITQQLLAKNATQNFSVTKNNNTQVSWSLHIPKDLQAVTYTIGAKANNFSDAEQNTLPVLSNRMLVTESLPMWVNSNQNKSFTLNTLANSTSTSLTHHKLTLELTTNPAWYAVQALPYLMEYPYNCNEQIFSRYYANALAQHIVNSNPKIKTVFNQWKSSSSKSLLSNLEKNQDLKSLLIQETPWLRDAQSEAEQKQRIALLFDFNNMSNQLQTALQQLKNNQLPSGAWAWFNGGRDNRNITQHIIEGLGHLQHLNVIQNDTDVQQLIENGLRYLDNAFVDSYNKTIKNNKNSAQKTDNHLNSSQLHYLYLRSFFTNINSSKAVKQAMAFYTTQIQNHWLHQSLYNKGLMALITYRNGDTTTTAKLLNALVENSITNPELGMYWKANTNSYQWYKAPIETQALLIEAFTETGTTINTADKNTQIIDNLKIWLLKHKQTNQWKTTKATAQAVYALLLQNTQWLSVTNSVDVSVANTKITPKPTQIEAGTGYFKTTWDANQITKNHANVTLKHNGNGIAWGALYWQYFEDLDQITTATTTLKLSKQLYTTVNSKTGKTLQPITAKTPLNVGDLVTVKVELYNDRPMEYVHLKDMRAAGFEPINVLSGYKWQDGLGYYQSTKDAATHFFIDYLPKGTFVFEYQLRVNNAGSMSNGITSIQSMYAPEFSTHSKGQRVIIK